MVKWTLVPEETKKKFKEIIKKAAPVLALAGVAAVCLLQINNIKLGDAQNYETPPEAETETEVQGEESGMPSNYTAPVLPKTEKGEVVAEEAVVEYDSVITLNVKGAPTIENGMATIDVESHGRTFSVNTNAVGQVQNLTEGAKISVQADLNKFNATGAYITADAGIVQDILQLMNQGKEKDKGYDAGRIAIAIKDGGMADVQIVSIQGGRADMTKAYLEQEAYKGLYDVRDAAGVVEIVDEGESKSHVDMESDEKEVKKAEVEVSDQEKQKQEEMKNEIEEEKKQKKETEKKSDEVKIDNKEVIDTKDKDTMPSDQEKQKIEDMKKETEEKAKEREEKNKVAEEESKETNQDSIDKKDITDDGKIDSNEEKQKALDDILSDMVFNMNQDPAAEQTAEIADTEAADVEL